MRRGSGGLRRGVDVWAKDRAGLLTRQRARFDQGLQGYEKAQATKDTLGKIVPHW